MAVKHDPDMHRMIRRVMYTVWLVLALSLLSTPGQATPLYAGWSVSGQPFTAGGMNFSAEYRGNDIIAFNGALGEYILTLGDCRHTEEYEFCLEEIDHGGRAVYKGGKEYPGLNIAIKHLEPSVTIERSATPTTVDLGGRSQITVTLKNTGDKPALIFHYTDAFPPGVIVVSANGATNFQDHVEYNSVLSEGRTVQFKYTIEFRQFVEFDSLATARWGEDQEGNATSDPIHFAVNLPFGLQQKISPAKAELNVAMTYKLTLKNLVKREIQVTRLLLQVPSGITVSSTSNNLKKTGEGYGFSGPVRDDEEFELRFKLMKEGQYDLKAAATVSSEGKEFTKNIDMPLRIGTSLIIPQIDLPESAREGEKFHAKAVLRNMGDDSIANVTARMKGTLVASLNQSKVKVSDVTDYEMLNKDIIAPRVDYDTDFTIIVDGEYPDEKGRMLHFNAQRSITIKPQEKALALRLVTSKTGIAPGSTMDVKVFVKNLIGNPVNDVEVADLFPKKVNVQHGRLSATISSIGPYAEVQAYNYTLTVLSSFSDQKLQIRTIANANTRQGPYKTEKMTEIAVGKDIVNDAAGEEAAQTQDGNSSGGTATVSVNGTDTSGKPGIFARFWNWLKGLL